jgi:hypothetical protein
MLFSIWLSFAHCRTVATQYTISISLEFNVPIAAFLMIEHFRKYLLCVLVAIPLNVLTFHLCSAEVQRIGPLVPVPAISQRPVWDRFMILVWQYQTSIEKDIDLYRKICLRGFHIDRGADAAQLVDYSRTHVLPYYVDHAADKGILYLSESSAEAVVGNRQLIERPYSLANLETVELLKSHLMKNIEVTRNGPVLAYAFDDEISLGKLTTPSEVDIHRASLTWFREWLRHRYGTIRWLNKQWNTSFSSFEHVSPQGFEKVRKTAMEPFLSQWNLSPWMDFRHFMDFQFAAVLSELTRYANSIDPRTPAGFVGGQGPGPWGGYDYAMLARAVQWMEAYDIHGSNEILRSFWNRDRRPRMQTFFSLKNPKLDSWFLWYYLLHGNQAVIAWPGGWFRERNYEIAPYILANTATFEEIQGPISEVIVDPDSRFDPDPIGIYYSHPSIQAGWAMDAITHGSTWINRKSSIDDDNQTKGMLRKVWCKTLEDLGYQYDFVSYLDVQEGKENLSNRFKVIILPKTICLSDREAKALSRFVKSGGTLVADHLCGVLDEHGKGRREGALDDLFGITRNKSAGYLGGSGYTDINGEFYRKPFLDRLTNYGGAYRYKDIVVFERGVKCNLPAQGVEVDAGPSVFIRRKTGKGATVYLNLSPIEYWDAQKRLGNYGANWREIVSKILKTASMEPRVLVYENSSLANMVECLFWKNGENNYMGVVKNPTNKRELSAINEIQGITGKEVEIKFVFHKSLKRLVDLRNNRNLGSGNVFVDKLKPWQGSLYELTYH